ncbi:hypothetical protein Q9L58_002235 [Maublancomyces gigas]|uniref:Fe2OG dioxygenase domain-containing protein n=1 Tax=Discina gigas TaxID=1032678 RepID=A0ABR3GSC0_9PEZI
MPKSNSVPPPPPVSHAHRAPPVHIREVHKKYQKASIASLPRDEFLLDFGGNGVSEYHKTRVRDVGRIVRARAENVFRDFEGGQKTQEGAGGEEESPLDDILIYEHSSVPGFCVIPSLLPPSTQKSLLHRLLFRDLSNPQHKTNLNLHYNLPYSLLSTSPETLSSFFDIPQTTFLEPLDPECHKPLSVERMLEKKLRWMTLGGQYDWTRKEYPEKEKGEEVVFPQDVARLIMGLFSNKIIPQAAISNLYSPGDTLSPHRDVSESSAAALVSLSIGCDALFVIGLDDSSEVLVMRIRSGDAVIMDRESRWAWHSVPKILAETCPGWLADWPADGWMGRKRVNLNVRQMWD